MARTFDKKKRNTQNRKEKPILLMIAEGQNVTESQYFRSFQEQHSAFNIKILINGHITDPKGLLEFIEEYWVRNGLSEEKGDQAFVVVDLDNDEKKAKVIDGLIKQASKAQFIVSNPCFEIWFMLHFGYSTKSYLNGAAVVTALRSFIPDYVKNKDVSSILADKQPEAIKNAEQLIKYYDGLGMKWPAAECNPRTDVPIVINIINQLKEENEKKM